MQHDETPVVPEIDSENHVGSATGPQPQDHAPTVLLPDDHNDQPPPELVERAKKRKSRQRPVKCNEPGCDKWFLDSHRMMMHKRSRHPESLTQAQKDKYVEHSVQLASTPCC